jgi:hypothetical protein
VEEYGAALRWAGSIFLKDELAEFPATFIIICPLLAPHATRLWIIHFGSFAALSDSFLWASVKGSNEVTPPLKPDCLID